MTKFIVGLLAAFAAAAIFTAPAAEAHYVPPGGWGALELRVAHEYWDVQSAPSCATESIGFEEAFALGEAGEERAGYATEPVEPGTECVMHVWSALGVIRDCATVVHEFGHWLGLGHSSDPHNVMYPDQLWTTVPRGCWRLYKLGHPHATFAEARTSFFNNEPQGLLGAG